MDIHCNVRSCRKPLTGSLWVTRCSHSFCEEHASTLTHKNMKCPACNTVLGKRYDVIRQNSNPAEEFRAMFLVGLRPEIVLDIAMRAVKFWNYQIKMELKYRANSVQSFREAAEKFRENYAAMMKQGATAKKTCEGYERQIGDLKSSIKLLKDQITSKDKQLQKMQLMLNTMMNKMNQKLPNIQDNVSDSETFIPEHMGNALSQNIPGGMRDGHNFSPFNEPDFVFKPCFDVKR